jgi:cell growth-regulating nucleolar protein
MVYFICEACNESIKGNKVEQHSWKCKGCWYLNCMDCGKRFEGEEYKQHPVCMSEAQRYEGKFYVAKENKGDVKQQAWLESVQSRLDASPGNSALRPYVERLMQHDNLPRKVRHERRPPRACAELTFHPVASTAGQVHQLREELA